MGHMDRCSGIKTGGMATGAGLRRAVPTRPRMQVLDVQLEEPGKEEDFSTVRAYAGQVDEG